MLLLKINNLIENFTGSKYCAHFTFLNKSILINDFEDYSTFIIEVIKRSFSIKKITIKETTKNDENQVVNRHYNINVDFFFYGLDNSNKEILKLITYNDLIELRIYMDATFDLVFCENIFTNDIYYYQDGKNNNRAYFMFAAQINRQILKTGLKLLEKNSNCEIVEWHAELPVKLNKYGFNNNAKLNYDRQQI